MKIVITEEEKKHILSSHSFNDSFIKNNLKEALDKSNGIYTTETDQILVGILNDNKGMRVKIPKGTKVWHDYTKTDTTKIYLGNTGYVYYCDFKGNKNIVIDEKKNGSWSNDPLTARIRETFCNGDKIKSWRELTKGSKEIENPPGSAIDTEKPKDGVRIDSNCKNKNPYNAFTDAGLNWSVERKKWIDVKCNGTTPCILGNAQTNINLRNALCAGTWPLKADNQTPTTPVTPTTPTTPTTPVTPIVPSTNTTDNSGVVLKQFPELIFGDKTK